MKEIIKPAFVIIATSVATLLLSSGNSYGQIVDRSNIRTETVYIPKQDTVKILMLVCDTSRINLFLINGVEQTYSYDYTTWWQFGYEVYETEYGQVPCENPNLAMACYGKYRSKFIGRFDQNKKPLPKSIVVWMTKEIK